MHRIILAILFIIYLTSHVQAACHNNCHRKGRCSAWGTCDCFEGYEGNDCSRKSCPKGFPLADVATATDTAHNLATCSNQGTCDYSTGNCVCNSGYTGKSCSATNCFNDCNSRGVCVSLRSAAILNDGHLFNRTTTYNQWDADVIFGCKCDPGYSGADCSQRICEYGPDPRLDTMPREKVTLVCDCRGEVYCEGKFKLRFMGTVFKSWLYPTSTGADLAAAIMKTPGIAANNNGHVAQPVVAQNISEQTPLCINGQSTRTEINFKRNHGDLPALSIYANLLNRGHVYFEVSVSLFTSILFVLPIILLLCIFIDHANISM